MAHLYTVNQSYQRYPLSATSQYLLVYATIQNGCYEKKHFTKLLRSVRLPLDQPLNLSVTLLVEREMMIAFTRRERIVYVEDLPPNPTLEELFQTEEDPIVH